MTTNIELIRFYENRLMKVKEFWINGKTPDSFDWWRGMEYVEHAEQQLDAVKNGRSW